MILAGRAADPNKLLSSVFPLRMTSYAPDLPPTTVFDLLRHPRVLRLSWRPGMAKKRMLNLAGTVGQPQMWVEYITASTATDVLEKEHPDLIGRPRVPQSVVTDYLKQPLSLCEGDGTLWLVFSGQADCGGWMTRNAALEKYDVPDNRHGAAMWASKAHGLLRNAVLCTPAQAAHHFMAKQMAVEVEPGLTFCVVGEYLDCDPVCLGALPREMTQYSSLPCSRMDESDPRYVAMCKVLHQHRRAFLPHNNMDWKHLHEMCRQLP